MTIGSALFDDVRSRWAARIGPEQLETLETHLTQLTERRSFTAEDLRDWSRALRTVQGRPRNSR